MFDVESLEYNPTAEKVVDILCKKTQSDSPLFFRVLVAYYFSKVASMMRCKIATPDRGVIPVNMYAINLATSGFGKGHSTNIVEEQVIHLFKERFVEETYPELSGRNLAKLASKRAIKKGVPEEDELLRITKEFENNGVMVFSFDGGTPAAVKQMRHMLLMADCGSMNMEIDEIGSNLLGNGDVLTTLLELYDVGKVKQKLTKNTNENTRGEEIDGKTPTNMMLFGTPSKLLDGGKVEQEWDSMQETGYARRCFFGLTDSNVRNTELTPEELYDLLTDMSSSTVLQDVSIALAQLADMVNFGQELTVSKEVAIAYISYKSDCEKLARSLPDHQETKKAELSHRYWKALKLAGSYAFIEGSPAVELSHLHSAIKLAEDSGEAFGRILTRERNYVKLAKYLASVDNEVTHADLVEDLPFYKGSISQKAEMMTLAIAYGHTHNIIIKRTFNGSIEFMSGESLKETDMSKMIISYGVELAANYGCEEVPFDQLHLLTQEKGYHWVAHHLTSGYRTEDNAIPGFNMVVLDIDEGVTIGTVELLMKDFTYQIYTTKRHTEEANRFRVILPMSHVLKLNAPDYVEFMQNIYDWLPFEVDDQTNQRARKWESYPGTYEYNDGELLDSLLFIPKTVKSVEQKQVIDSQQSLSNVERWFINNTKNGNRSNQYIKYALLLVDSGMEFDTINGLVSALNSKLPEKMEEAEIATTIMRTVAKAIHTRDITA